MTFYGDMLAQKAMATENAASSSSRKSNFFTDLQQNGSVESHSADDIEDYMKENESLFCSYKNITIFCGTYNVNGQSCLKSDLSKWLKCKTGSKEPADIYAIGFQELDRSQQAYLYAYSAREDEWASHVKIYLPKHGDYVELGRVRLVGIFLLVYVKKSMRLHVDPTCSSSATVATGLMNFLGNKGGVAATFKLFDSRLCFVVSHLAAGSEELLRRNQDFREICKLQFFQTSLNPDDKLDLFGSHDLIFWLGDLNYRLQNPLSGESLDAKIVKEKCSKKLYDELLECDQLLDVRRKSLAFQEFKEGLIEFAPTYKYDTGTTKWDSSEKCRPPAWTDRILWYGDQVEQILYDSIPEILLSDHKPVLAIFKAKIKVIDREKEKKIYESALKHADRQANERLPQAEIDKLDFDFFDVKFRDPQIQIFTIRNIGKDKFQYVLREKDKDDKTKKCCEPWISITPPVFHVLPNESVTVTVTVFVDKFSIQKFAKNDYKLSDILVLQLKGGKEFFLTISASCKPTCFGRPLISGEQTTAAPPSDVPTAALIDLTPEDDKSVKDEQQPTTVNLPKLVGVPNELFRLIDHVTKFGLETPGLFVDESGSQEDFVSIRDSLDAGEQGPFKASIFSVMETLLVYLDTLPEPVIPHKFTEECLRNCDDWNGCKKIINNLPECHRLVFMFVIEFLKALKNKGHKNGCTSSSLASIFAPFLLKPNGENPPPENRVSFFEHRLKCAAQFVNNWILH